MTVHSHVLDRDKLLSGLLEARQNILREAARLSRAQEDQIFLGTWSVKDLIAHLIGWDETNLRAVKSILKGKVPSFYKHHDRDWRTYNARLVKKHKTESLEDLLAAAKQSQAKLIEFVQTIPAEKFDKDFGVRFRGYRVTIQRLLQVEAQDEQTHYQQIVSYFTGSG